MADPGEFITRLETKVSEQLGGQRVGYLLGAGSSYLRGQGYPLAAQLWDLIKERVTDAGRRAEIQAKLDMGANGLEDALDLLDDGGANDTPYRGLVTDAIGDLFLTMEPNLELHQHFVRRLSHRADPAAKVFNLNYDPCVERAAEVACVRLADGFIGAEHGYFDPNVFEERIGRIRGSHKGRQFEETVRPIHLCKLHGSMGWYESQARGVRRCAFGCAVPPGAKRLMIPPQRRKATNTMLPPYSALWSTFRAALVHGPVPLNRLVCIGYGFSDEHVNDVIEPALARGDFTLLIFALALSDAAWSRWSVKKNIIVVTQSRCSIMGEVGPGHRDLWSFERLCEEV